MNSYLISKSDKIFLAGHNGMVGKSILRALKIKNYTNILTEPRNKLDLCNFQEVSNWFNLNKPNIVILAAAKVGGIYANNSYPADFLLENLKIQNNVIECALGSGIRRLLFLGSSCIYPKLSKQPIKEESILTGSLESTNEWYAIAKISGIKLCESLRKQYGFDAISLMPTNLYGPGDNYNLENSHVMAALIRKFTEAVENKEKVVKCWGSGNVLREFLHVHDLGEASIFALEKWDPESLNSPKSESGESLTYLNVGTGIDIKIKDLAILISELVGFKGDIEWDKSKPDGTPKKQLDVARFNQLGWTPSIDLRTGILETLRSYRNEVKNNSLRL